MQVHNVQLCLEIEEYTLSKLKLHYPSICNILRCNVEIMNSRMVNTLYNKDTYDRDVLNSLLSEHCTDNKKLWKIINANTISYEFCLS